MKTKIMVGLFGVFRAIVFSQLASGVDAVAAQALAKKEGCLKCHAIDKKKEGASLKEISGMYKGKADAEAKLIHHITSGEKVKFEDGREEEHKMVKTKDEAEIKNLIDWILSLN